jgi:hypothetical protein
MHFTLLTCLPTPSPTARLSKFAWGRVKVNSSLLQELSLDDDDLALITCSRRLFTYEYIEHITSCLTSDGHGT